MQVTPISSRREDSRTPLLPLDLFRSGFSPSTSHLPISLNCSRQTEERRSRSDGRTGIRDDAFALLHEDRMDLLDDKFLEARDLSRVYPAQKFLDFSCFVAAAEVLSIEFHSISFLARAAISSSSSPSLSPRQTGTLRLDKFAGEFNPKAVSVLQNGGNFFFSPENSASEFADKFASRARRCRIASDTV